MHIQGKNTAFLIVLAIAFLSGCSSRPGIYTVSSLTPSEITAGSTDFPLIITGTNFRSNTMVLFGSQTLTPTAVSPMLLQVTVPSSAVTSAGVVNVAVTGSPTSAPLQFTVKNPLPAISSLSQPEVLLNSTAVSLDVAGSNFVSTSTVQLGESTLKPSSFTSAHLTVAVPDTLLATAQVLKLSVVNPSPGGGTSAPISFTVANPAPAVTLLSTESALVSSTAVAIEVSGTNFLPSSVVTLGSTPLTPVSITPTQLTVAVPDSLLSTAQVLGLSVMNPGPGGGTSSSLNFTVLNPQPTITDLSVEEAALNSSVLSLTITGTGFVSGTKVSFGSMTLDPATVTSTSITVNVPTAAFQKSAVQDVTVVSSGPGGGTSNGHPFTVKNPVPSLASLSAAKALAGSDDLTLDLTGAGFVSGESSVHFGSMTLTPASTTSDQISVVIPKAALAQSGTVSVDVATTEPGGGKSNALEFTVENPVPTLTALSLDNIIAGSASFDLTLTGANFIQSSVISFGGVQLTPAALSGSQITLTIPMESLLDAGQFPIVVSNPGPGGGASSALSFTVSNPLPSVSAISPTTAIRLSSDTTLTISGSGFVHQSTVLLGTSSLAPSSYTATEITLTIPESAVQKTGRLNVGVVNPGPGGGTSNTMEITVANPKPQLSYASPAGTSVRTTSLTVVLNGSGFNDETTVKLTRSGSSEAVSLTPESIGPTAITLVVPSGYLSTVGTLAFAVDNPDPGGGDSEPVNVVVNEHATTDWQTVVNNKTSIPDASGLLFNSYNQPSVSNRGMVVFKGQSKADSGPIIGIFTRDMSSGNLPVRELTGRGVPVPQPNNTIYNGALAGFNQFPSFPRIDMDTDNVAFRGQSKPSWTFTTPDGLESRIGSAGVFTNVGGGDLKTGVSLLGALPDFAYFKVPSADATRFDQFPGSPSIYHSTIVFKGNYTVGDTGKTGVYFRDVNPDPQTGEHPVQKIADSDTMIPGQAEGGTVTFGSTAPPSAADGKMVFLGVDKEDAPTLGGIYLAPLVTTPPSETAPIPTLTSLVKVGTGGTQVPGEAEGVTFSKLGEGLSFDGRFIAFWAAWGTETRARALVCSADGSTDMLAACNTTYPSGFTTEVPIHQGIFVYDTQDTETPFHSIAKTDGVLFSDFLYWVFSGRPPTVGGTSGSGSGNGEDGGDGGTGPDVVPEPPRWRSSAFVAVEGASPTGAPNQDLFKVAFKGQNGTMDGIYLVHSSDPSRIQTVVDTTSLGSDIDKADAPADSLITTIGMERDGLRNDQLVITSSMLNPVTTESNAGVYITKIAPLSPPSQP